MAAAVRGLSPVIITVLIPSRQGGRKAERRRECDRLIVITDEEAHDRVLAPSGKGYLINVASYKNGVGYGKWTHIDGWSESVIAYIRAWSGQHG
jgi:60 kDa SS-A/Ro ribonucleoprotein